MVWDKLQAILSGMRTLLPDWDGEGGKPPAPALLDTADDVLRVLRDMAPEGMPAPTAITPASDGTVHFAWYRGKRYFEIEVEKAGGARWYRSDPGRTSESGKHLDKCIEALIGWAAS